MPLQPTHTFNLGHGPNRYTRAGRRFLFAAASADGALSLFGETGVRPIPHSLQGIRAISLNESGELLAVSHDAGLAIMRLDGSIVFSADPPKPTSTPKTSSARPFEVKFGSILFDTMDGSLWCAAATSPQQIEIQRRGSTDWSVVESITIEDPLYESGYFLQATPRSGPALWLGGGQDGLETCWIVRGESLTATLDPLLQDLGPPVFSPSGFDFLAGAHDLRSIRRFKFPEVEEIGACETSEVDLEKLEWDDDYDLQFDPCLVYLDERHALIEVVDGRPFLFDVENMCLLREVLIEDHLPAPVSAYYPQLTAEQLCTDLISFDECGDLVMFIFRQDPGQVLLFSKTSFL